MLRQQDVLPPTETERQREREMLHRYSVGEPFHGQTLIKHPLVRHMLIDHGNPSGVKAMI